MVTTTDLLSVFRTIPCRNLKIGANVSSLVHTAAKGILGFRSKVSDQINHIKIGICLARAVQNGAYEFCTSIFRGLAAFFNFGKSITSMVFNKRFSRFQNFCGLFILEVERMYESCQDLNGIRSTTQAA